MQPAFDRLGCDATPAESADHALLRARLIGALGEFDDEAIVARAQRRFALFVKDPDIAARPTFAAPSPILSAGHADRATYDILLALARKTTNTDERVRYYSAAASARDPALAGETLAIALTDELPSSFVGTLISEVAGQGEHPDLAWSFVQANFAALAAAAGTVVPQQFCLEPDGEISPTRRTPQNLRISHRRTRHPAAASLPRERMSAS